MLNYLWAGLIALSFIFALVTDIRDLRRDTYRNGVPLPLVMTVAGGYDPASRRLPVMVRGDSAAWSDHYGTPVPGGSFTGELTQTAEGRELRFAKDAALPEPLATVRSLTSERDNDLRGSIDFTAAAGDTLLRGTVTLAPVRFVKLVAITRAALDLAKTAVTLALGLIGVIALWLGMLRIADKAGLINVIVRVAEPVFRPLFPDLPRGHPVLGLIILNVSANMLGLGNAATPMGIKAMEELQKLNPKKDTATNAMVTLLALNTASVQIVPPVLLVAIMGLSVNRLYFPIMIGTATALVAGLAAVRLLGRLPVYRDSDPMRAPAPTPEG